MPSVVLLLRYEHVLVSSLHGLLCMRPNIGGLTGLIADMFCPPFFIQLSVASYYFELDGLLVARSLISCIWAGDRRRRMSMLDRRFAPVRSIICPDEFAHV